MPFFKTYHVFNLEQTTLPPAILKPEFRIDSIETLIEKLGAIVSHFGNQAYFDFANDIIVLPSPDRFTSKENYYATLLHELIHWTAKNRVPRDCFNKYHIDIKERAEEELIAEIGSVFLATYYGIKGELEYHASYIASWKTLLNEKQIMNSIHKATKAFEWIIDHSKEELVS
ncbi:MAG: hypothetical protein K0R24_1243 [Gammaproteobacteria bacterium]|nr:hypothetical protein [Gammaproteobacteria bacterium]